MASLALGIAYAAVGAGTAAAKEHSDKSNDKTAIAIAGAIALAAIFLPGWSAAYIAVSAFEVAIGFGIYYLAKN